jgi:hypothetical protein
MKPIKPITILLLACFQVFGSYSQTNPVLNYLPEEPKIIFKINPASLGQKIKWEELLQYKMFEDLMKEIPGDGKSFLNDPSQTGIDMSQGFFIVVSQNKNNEKPEPVIYCIPKDTVQFANMIKKLTHGKQTVKTGKGNLIIDKKTVVAWNHEIVMLTEVSYKESVINQNAKAKATAVPVTTKQLTEKGKALLNKRQIPFSNEKFLSLLNQNGDLLFWIDNSLQSEAKKNNKIPEAFGMIDKNFMRKGNSISGVVNFENGEIVMKMKQYVSGSLDSLYQKYPLKNINTDLVKKLPAGQPIALCSFSLSPEMLTDIYAKSGFDKLIDSITKHKIKINEMLPAIKGDLMLSVIKVEQIDPEDSVTQAMNGLQLFIAGNINDREKFKDLVSLLQVQKQDSTKKNPPKKMKPVILSDESIFVVSLSQNAAQRFLESAGKNEEMEKLIYPYKNYPSAFIIDLRTIFGFALQSMSKGKSEEEARQASEVLGMFDKMICFGGKHDDNSVGTTMELTLTNKTENSLKQFLNMMNLFYSWKPKSSTAYKQ